MASKTTKTYAETYPNDLVINQSSGVGVDTTTRLVTDGIGNNTAISLSDDVLSVQPVTDDTTGTMLVKNQGGSAILTVDTTNSKVLTGSSQIVTNTNYAFFGMNASDSSSMVATDHYAIPFLSGAYSASVMLVPFGTGDDPDDTFTTSTSSGYKASQLVTMLWRIPDNITISEVKHLEGADSSGDTTRMHLKSYDFTSDTTSTLTGGTLLAHTTADNVVGGSAKAYLRDWSLDSADVDAGKVILCFWKQDGVNADYSVTATIKYFLR